MKPHAVGSVCGRVQAALDEALSTGTLSLPPELGAHADRCPRCGPEVRDTETLLTRLSGAAAGIPLGRVPQAVDAVLAQIASESSAKVVPMDRPAEKRVKTRWLVGQVAAAVAVLVLTTGSLGYVLLKVNEAVSGVKPGDVMARIVSPFRQSETAKVPPAK